MKFGQSLMIVALAASTLVASADASSAGVQDGSGSALEAAVMAREMARDLAPIRSRSTLEELQASGRLEQTMLGQLPEDARKRFTDSLVFSERGLASFSYPELRSNLDGFQIYQLLALFGAQHSLVAIPGIRGLNTAEFQRSDWWQVPPLMVDYPDKVCSAKASCTPWSGGICIGDNC